MALFSWDKTHTNIANHVVGNQKYDSESVSVSRNGNAANCTKKFPVERSFNHAQEKI